MSLCDFERSFEFVSEITLSNGSIAELSLISISWEMVQTFDGQLLRLVNLVDQLRADGVWVASHFVKVRRYDQIG